MIGGIEVIDFHGHAGLWDGTGMVDDVDRMVAAMDAVGVDRSCIFGIFHLDGRRGNDRTAAMIAARPERFIGFAYVSPLMTDTMLDELTRAIDRLGFRALKLYAKYTPYRISDPQWDPIYAFADARGLAVLHHTDERCSPAHLAEAARRFPNARFVAAHSGNTPPARKLAIAAARELPNYYLETASTFRTPGVTEELVAGAGGGAGGVRIGYAAHGPTAADRQDYYRGHLGRGEAPDPGRERTATAGIIGRPHQPQSAQRWGGDGISAASASWCGGGRGLGVVCSGGCGEGGVWWPRP